MGVRSRTAEKERKEKVRIYRHANNGSPCSGIKEGFLASCILILEENSPHACRRREEEWRSSSGNQHASRRQELQQLPHPKGDWRIWEADDSEGKRGYQNDILSDPDISFMNRSGQIKSDQVRSNQMEVSHRF